MNKQTKALKMAIEAMDWELGGEPLPTLMIEARNACKEALASSSEALEQPAQDYVLICKRCGDDLGIVMDDM